MAIRMNVLLEEKTYKDFQKKCIDNNISVSEKIRELIDKFINK